VREIGGKSTIVDERASSVDETTATTITITHSG